MTYEPEYGMADAITHTPTCPFSHDTCEATDCDCVCHLAGASDPDNNEEETT